MLYKTYVIIYYLGMLTNIWYYFFVYDMPERYFQRFFDLLSTNQIDNNSIFLFKAIFVLV